MKGQLDDEEENENLIETEQKGLDYFLTKVKIVIFKVLFVLAKEEKADDQMIYFYILTSLDYVQMHSFPFNNKILYVWKADSFLINILNFVNVFSISTYVPNLSYFALLVSVYICLSAILLIILNIIYVSYSFSQNKFKFMWPVYVLRQVAFYFVTVFFLPITETLTSILQCYNDPVTNEYVIYGYDEINVQCWQGWHIFHALITLLFMLIFVLICAIVAYAFFEPGMTSGNRTARQDSNGEVAFIINKVTCQVLYCFLGKNESWILVLTTFTLQQIINIYILISIFISKIIKKQIQYIQLYLLGYLKNIILLIQFMILKLEDFTLSLVHIIFGLILCWLYVKYKKVLNFQEV